MSGIELGLTDTLALDRTRMAAERTLMAWVRTSLSMISFGFTIYKFLQLLQSESTSPVVQPQGPRNVGLTLIGIGTVALIIACAQYRQQVGRLKTARPHRQLDLTFLVACLLGVLGVIMFGSILLNAGPLG